MPSEAHIFPDAMGGVTSTTDTICKKCNHKINQAFEQKEVSKFAFFQSIWRIKSRRGKVQGVSATVEYEDKRFKVSLDERGLPKTPLIFHKRDNAGKKHFNIIGPELLVLKKQKEIEKKEPSIKWEEKDLSKVPPPESVIEIASDIARKPLRRLAAKVAYERWGQLRGPIVLNDSKYDAIRDFIISSTESNVLCGILSDLRLLNGMLNFSAGHHGVVILAHPRSRILGAFVTFYSLFYYWVILASNYQAIAAIDEALIEDPQNHKSYVPLLRSNTGNLLVHWSEIIAPFLSDPKKVESSLMKYASTKFQEAAEEGYAPREIRHELAQPITGEGRDKR